MVIFFRFCILGSIRHLYSFEREYKGGFSKRFSLFVKERIALLYEVQSQARANALIFSLHRPLISIPSGVPLVCAASSSSISPRSAYDFPYSSSSSDYHYYYVSSFFLSLFLLP